MKKKISRHKNRRKKGIGRYAGDTLTWVPSWKGAQNGKRWAARLREIQAHLDAQKTHDTATPSIRRRISNP